MIRDAKRMVGLGTFKVGAEGRATVTLPARRQPARTTRSWTSRSSPTAAPRPTPGVSVLRSPAAPA